MVPRGQMPAHGMHPEEWWKWEYLKLMEELLWAGHFVNFLSQPKGKVEDLVANGRVQHSDFRIQKINTPTQVFTYS